MTKKNKFVSFVEKILEKLRERNHALCEMLDIDYDDIAEEQSNEEEQKTEDGETVVDVNADVETVKNGGADDETVETQTEEVETTATK